LREAVVKRTTNETDIDILLKLDGPYGGKVESGIGFLDHMLDLFAFRAGMRLDLGCKGDLEVDGHHTAEDIGIALGQAIAKALGSKEGIARYGDAAVPMDESLARVTLDISGRPYLVFNAAFPDYKAGDFETGLAEEFFRALATHAGLTLHINLEYGKNTHHMLEAIFKAFGIALGQACKVTGAGVQSTKGML
jgi:imidazoleglycerol-phosphate dehydratase